MSQPIKNNLQNMYRQNQLKTN